MDDPTPSPRFASFAEFYPYYLSEHRHPVSRRLHVIGSALVLVQAGIALYSGDARWIPAALATGYGFAWTGHFFFEHNRPATFRHPFYSFAGDWAMLRDVLLGRIPF